jgi:hypothetical protein
VIAKRLAAVALTAGLLIVALLGLAQARTSDGAEAPATAHTASFIVHLTLDRGTAIGPQAAFVELRDRQSRPVPGATVLLAPVMEEMGHALPVLPATASPDAPGSYRADGEIFSMPGAWAIDVRIETAGPGETARFGFDLT